MYLKRSNNHTVKKEHMKKKRGRMFWKNLNWKHILYNKYLNLMQITSNKTQKILQI